MFSISYPYSTFSIMYCSKPLYENLNHAKLSLEGVLKLSDGNYREDSIFTAKIDFLFLQFKVFLLHLYHKSERLGFSAVPVLPF